MKKVVFTFGRMNPPTIGHQKLVNKVKDVAKTNRADAKVFLSHTQNNKKDPLDYATKMRFAKKAFGSIAQTSRSKTIIQILQELEKMGYTHATLVVGSDRTKEFAKLLNKYNGREYNFDSIDVVSAGERDPDAEGVSGMSASKLRALAKEGDFKTFSTGLPRKLSSSDAKKIYDTIRSVVEEIEEQRKPLTIQQRLAIGRRMRVLAPKIARKRAIKLRKMAGKEQLKKRAAKAARKIIRKKVAGTRGLEYQKLSPSEKITIDKMVAKKSAVIQKLAKRLMPKITKSERERLKALRKSKNEEFIFERQVPEDPAIKDREGSQPRKYHTGLAKSTKVTRDKQFKRGSKMSSDDPKAYPDKHAGDTGVKTKLSKHTKKYRDMFGEQDSVKRAKEDIKREKEADKRKHDAMLDRARTQDTQAKNQQTESYELTEDSKEALKKKAEKSGISYSILKKVYDRGMAAWRTGHRPGASQQQWAYARVNSFITGGKTRTTGDADLWKQHKGTKKESVEENARADARRAMRFDKDVQQRPFSKDIELSKADKDDARKNLLLQLKKSFDTKGKHDVQFKDGKKVKVPMDVTLKALKKWADMRRPADKAKLIATMSKSYRDMKKAINEACWDGYKQAGMKKKGDKMVPNCVPEAKNRAQQAAIAIAKKEKGEKPKESFEPHMMYDPKSGKSQMAKVPADHEKLAKMGYTHEKPKEKKNLKSMLAIPKARPVSQPEDITESFQTTKSAGVGETMYASEFLKVQGAFEHHPSMMNEKGGAGEEGTDKLVKKYKKDTPLQEAIQYHIDNNLSIKENVFRPHSDKYYEFFRECRKLYESGDLLVSDTFDITLLESDAGEVDFYEGMEVPLDIPLLEADKDVELNKPKRGGPKKFYVYVKDPSTGNVKKVTFGDTSGLKAKLDNPEARKSFVARHKCDQKKDKTKPGYWACRLPYYAKELGLSGGGSFFW